MSEMKMRKGRYTPLLAVGVPLLLGLLFLTACTAMPAGAPAAVRTAVATKVAEATKVASTSSQAITKTTAMTTTEMTKTVAAAAAPMFKLYKDAKLGDILVDDSGMVIYVFDKDAKDKSNCTGNCSMTWPAVTVKDEAIKPASGPGVSATFGVIERDDGTYQVTINGMPVYHYAKDTKADESSGQGVGDVWWVITAKGEKDTAH